MSRARSLRKTKKPSLTFAASDAEMAMWSALQKANATEERIFYEIIRGKVPNERTQKHSR
jgi:hypothetical protein